MEAAAITGAAFRGSPPPPPRARASGRSAGWHKPADPPSPRSSPRSRSLGKAELPAQLARWLDELDETGRWALLKLVTGAMRIGVSARLAKTAAAALGDKEPHEIELMWPGLAPPYAELFAWLEGRADKPVSRRSRAVPPGDAGARDRGGGFRRARSRRFHRRMEMGRHPRAGGERPRRARGNASRGSIRAPARTFPGSFPDLTDALRLRRRHRRRAAGPARRPRAEPSTCCSSGSTARPSTPKLMAEFPAHLRAYDLLGRGRRAICATLPFAERRARLEAFVAQLDDPRVDLSPTVPFASLGRSSPPRAPIRPPPARARTPRRSKASCSSAATRSMCRAARRASGGNGSATRYIIDAVLMYAQRGHGKRSSFYSDYTFGVWTRGDDGDELVPVGKAYFGFTDEELLQIDRFVRRNTDRTASARCARSCTSPTRAWCWRSPSKACSARPRHKSGVAMRFPRINRLRWDKLPREADRLETLETACLRDADASRALGSGTVGGALTPTGGFPICPACRAPTMRLDKPAREIIRCPTTPGNCRQPNDGLYRSPGGSPLAVAFRLILLSILSAWCSRCNRFRIPGISSPPASSCCFGGSGSRLRRRSTGCGAISSLGAGDRHSGLAVVAHVRRWPPSALVITLAIPRP